MNLSKSIQENILRIISFDTENYKIFRGMVPLRVYDTRYKPIVKRIYNYIDEFDEPPKSHLVDITEDLLKDDKSYLEVIEGIYELEDVNVEYTLKKVRAFIRLQEIKLGILKAAEVLEIADDEDTLEEAEDIIIKSIKNTHKTFDPGLEFSVDALSSLDQESIEYFRTGIAFLDSHNLGPARKKLHLFMAPAKFGKSWWLIHVGKENVMDGKKVLHLTLEMSQSSVARRYMQSFFSISNRKELYSIYKFIYDSEGRFNDLEAYEIYPKHTFDEDNLKEKIKKRIEKGKRYFDNLIIKEFPTSSLAVRELDSYLDMLERVKGFIPDIIIVDYADLLRLEGNDKRIATGEIYKNLRGLAMSRNVAIATATQTNRGALNKRLVSEIDVSEDYSKIQTADCVITLNKTDAERELGLARLYVTAARDDVDKMEICISQAYGIGQFALDSALVPKDYDTFINKE